MNEEKNRQIYEKYLEATHRLGRLSCAVTLLLLLGAPFVMGAYLGAMPDLGAFGKGFASIGLVYFVSCVAEYLIYVPMLGAGGSYLAFITGNLINMKIPCAVNARDIVGAKSGTAENEIISTLSIATSSLVTILVLALGCCCSFRCSRCSSPRPCSPPLTMWCLPSSGPWPASTTGTTAASPAPPCC